MNGCFVCAIPASFCIGGKCEKHFAINVRAASSIYSTLAQGLREQINISRMAKPCLDSPHSTPLKFSAPERRFVQVRALSLCSSTMFAHRFCASSFPILSILYTLSSSLTSDRPLPKREHLTPITAPQMSRISPAPRFTLLLLPIHD